MSSTISASKSVRRSASARPLATTRPALIAHFTILATLAVLLLRPAHVTAQGRNCVEIDFDVDPPGAVNLCKGIGKLRVPVNPPPTLIEPFLTTITNQTIKNEALGLINNPTIDRYSLLISRFMLSPAGLSGWGQSVARCQPKGLHGRWYRALTCSTFVQMSNGLCQPPSAPPRPILCPKEIKEAWATWEQALEHSSNSCPPEWKAAFASTVANSKLFRESNANSCFPGSKVETEDFCGFPTNSQACANSCRTTTFVSKMTNRGASIEQACKQAMSQRENTTPALNFDPVPALTEANFKGLPGLATSPTGAAGTGDGTATGSPSTTDGAFPPTTTDSATLGFMDRPIAGIAGKFWVIGGVGIVGIAVILVGVIMMRRRTAASMAAKSRNMRFEESGSTPRDGFGEKPPALALGTLTTSRVPQQGPMPPTDEYGAYNNNGQSPPPHQQQQQHYSNDRKDFFPPSPTQDHFRHPRSPSPPPPHAAHAQGGWQGPHQDAYGSMAPPPPPAKDLGAGRPETWTKIAQRDSTRPPSMMPRDPVYPRSAILSYIPRLEDELEVHVGDQVAVWEDYADGYAWGETMDGRQGVFPVMCLADPNVPLEHQLPPPPQHMQQQAPPQMQQQGGEPLRDMQEGGVRETMVNPQAYRFTQYTVASDISDDDVVDYRGHPQQPMPQQAYHQQQPPQQQQQQHYAQQPQQQYYSQPQGQGQGQQRW